MNIYQMKIYHLVEEKQWRESKANGDYSPPSLQQDGFIYCSMAEQVIDSANRFYPGSESLLLIKINPGKVPAQIILEDLHGRGIPHPHIYGTLPMRAVEAVIPMKPDADGRFTSMPKEGN